MATVAVSILLRSPTEKLNEDDLHDADVVLSEMRYVPKRCMSIQYERAHIAQLCEKGRSCISKTLPRSSW